MLDQGLKGFLLKRVGSLRKVTQDIFISHNEQALGQKEAKCAERHQVLRIVGNYIHILLARENGSTDWDRSMTLEIPNIMKE